MKPLIILSLTSHNLLYSAIFFGAVVVVFIYMHTFSVKRQRRRILSFLDDFYADRVSYYDIQAFAAEFSELPITACENLDKNYAPIVQKLQDILRKRGDIHSVIKSDGGEHNNFFTRKYQAINLARTEIETTLNAERKKTTV